MATTHVETGTNKTGIATSKARSAAMVDATRRFEPNPPGDELFLAEARTEAAREVESIGSVPPPSREPTTKKLGAEELARLVDKLGERLAFERTGVRMYEALLSKLEASRELEGGPEREDLVHILKEEYEHFRLLEGALRELGADPSAMTPSADVSATMSAGAVAVALDPRTSLAQCLEAALLLELADNESWEALSEMARGAGRKELVESFESAIEAERDHLMNVREWVAAAQGRAR